MKTRNIRSQRGFTLIELLAVIVILAIIALISIPIIMQILSKVRKETFKQSVRGILESATIYALTNPEVNNLDTINVADLEFQNKKDYTGSVKKIDGIYYADKICNHEFCVSGPSDKLSEVVAVNEIRALDDTPPTVQVYTLSSTSSINVNVKALDVESGISKIIMTVYDGENIKETKTVNNISEINYTFKQLSEKHDYIIEVKVVNNSLMNNEANTTTVKRINVKTEDLNKPTAVSSPSGYSQSKTVVITFNGGGTYLVRPTMDVTTNIEATACSENGVADYICNGTSVSASGNLEANTWYQVTSSPTLTLEANGSIYYKVVDGTNYKDGGSTTIVEIDRTEPSMASVALKSSTTNSMTVTASGSDEESGILKYQFSIDNGSWEPKIPQDSNEYTFHNVTSEEHSIKVRVINGTYQNNDQNNLNTKESDSVMMAPGELIKPTAVSSPSGYSQSKEVTINFTGSGTYLIKTTMPVKTNMIATTCIENGLSDYTCNGTSIPVSGNLEANTWYQVASSPTLTLETNGSIYYKVVDGINYKDGGSTTIVEIDRTEPELTAVTKGKKAILTSSDLESGLAEQPYRCDDGAWQSSNICVFETTGTHTVTAKNGAGVLKTNTVNISIIGNPPVLANLTPVVYKNNNWYVADTSKIWYDYENQEWANAVLLKSGSKSPGQIVDISTEAKAMFVWIPRYEYLIDTQFGKHSDGTLGTSANPGLINVRFVSNDSGQTYKNSETNYGVHPAFQFGDKSLAGMWVGKYTTSGSIDEPTILPDVSLLMNQTAETMSNVSRKISVTGFDSHMVKQSEWGAVLYLAKSIYGIGDMSGIIFNTTNNEYGIDNFGSTYTEAVLSGWEIDHTSSNLSFLQDSKYYDSYTYTDQTFNNSCNGGICFGHALSEMNKWYSDNDVSAVYNSGCYWITHFSSGGINNPGVACGFAYPGVGPDWNIQFRIALS